MVATKYLLEVAEEGDFLGPSSVCQMPGETLKSYSAATILREVLSEASRDGWVNRSRMKKGRLTLKKH